MTRLLRTTALFIAMLLVCGHAHASTCTLLTVVTGAVSFGFYSGTDIHSNGSVTVACTILTGTTMPSFTVALSAGNSNNFAQRQMGEVLGTENLNYNIYADAGFATIWGNGMAPSIIQSYNASAGLGTITYTAYGDLPANQYVGAGVYGDAITVTVTY